MLVGPAGFGKTTLASQWLGHRQHGWYRGSSASADVAALAAGLARASGTVVPGAGRRMIERLGISGAPPPTAGTLANMLGEDLAGWPAKAWLAVDDYHFAMQSNASETFVEELLARCPVQLLITSRARPSWATARRMLYGEILEVGRSALALTHEEAGQVLADRKAEEVAGVLAISEGWPAVIGLASLSNNLALSGAEVPDELYGYCAEELFQRFERELQRALCTLALAPTISLGLVQSLYGEEAAGILDAAEDGGFVTRGHAGDYDMHPLLRTVLLRKLEEEGGDRAGRALRELAAYLIKTRRWDEAFAVAERADDSVLLERVIDGALDDLIAEGRLETMKRWIERVRTDSPSAVLDLAEAEIAFREGDHHGALRHALNATAQFPEGHARLSQSWYRAGQSAYFLDRTQEAHTFYERAKSTSVTPRETKTALWGLFNAALDMEDQGADSFLQQLEAIRPLTLTEDVRLVGGRLFSAIRWGGLEGALEPAKGVVSRISGLDPVAQTGFMNQYSNALLLTGRYPEALEMVDREVAVATEFSIDFVLPHALLVKGLASIGLRKFRDGEEALRRASSHGQYFSLAATTFAARVPLYDRRPGDALALLAAVEDVSSIPSLRAEFLATKALALAELGRFDEATQACDAAERLSRTIEASVLIAHARAILAARARQADAATLAQQAFRLAAHFGNLDTAVCGYRSFPEILRPIAQAPDLRDVLRTLLGRANDAALARRAGIDSSVHGANWQLTKREEEILDLLGQALTNKQIAERLFLAESTVKVHVRRVLRKVGARSRTEAAIWATRKAEED